MASSAGESKVPIYLDYNGTTPVDKEVCQAMSEMMYTHWGNPSSSHYFGVQAKRALESARRHVAELIGGKPDEITFMSNGTETINHALKGLAELCEKEGKNHLVTQATEHVAVLEVCRALERRGCTVTYLPVDTDGLVSADAVEAAITPRTFCVSIMHSNNETGALQPIQEIVARSKRAGDCVYVHCDTSQSLGKLPVNVDELGVDFLTVAGHKVYAPKGVGALYQRRTVPKLPLFLHGGGQEGGRRASTENMVHCVALGKACEVSKRDLAQSEIHLRTMRERLHTRLIDLLGSKADLMRLNGPRDHRLPNTLSVSFYRVDANTLLSEISDEVAASAGAACHSDEVEVSHVLLAMGVPVDWAMGTCRFTVGRSTTEAEVDAAAKVIATAVARLMPSGVDSTADAKPAPTLAGDAVKLTKFTHGMGCACKLRPQLLEEVLEQVRARAGALAVDPNIVAGLGRSNEDACVYRISDETAVVGTLDFFTPVVDEPEAFGAVAASNALSDVYAMGARPLFALSIVGFPSARLPKEILASILSGAQQKCAEAGIAILGGHTVEDSEPKYGLAVVGTVHPAKVWRNNGVQPGDALLLTKPIGSGVLSTAMKRGVLGAETRAALTANMSSLNRTAAECGLAQGNVHAATDVTGFGLLGHLREMLTPPEGDDHQGDGDDGRAKKRPRKETTMEPSLGATIHASKVPLLPEALELARDDQCIPGGTLNNLQSAEAGGAFVDPEVPRELRILMADAQTSGGLLFAVPNNSADAFLRRLRDAGLKTSAIIGSVRSRYEGGSMLPVIHVVE